MSVWSELGRFSVVGSIGFAVDAGVLQLLVSVALWSPFSARLASFPVALTATFLLNRAWTFRHRRTVAVFHAYTAYTVIQTIGALINFAVFSACIFWSVVFNEQPVLALAVGSIVALAFNFSASRVVVFRSRDESRG